MRPQISALRLLVVEDQPEARTILRGMLADIGISQICETGDGLRALGIISSAPDLIDVIFCDWNMPSMSGVDLLRRIRAMDLAIPFFMVTARRDSASMLEAKKAGVTAILQKPYSPSQIESKLRIVAGSISGK